MGFRLRPVVGRALGWDILRASSSRLPTCTPRWQRLLRLNQKAGPTQKQHLDIRMHRTERAESRLWNLQCALLRVEALGPPLRASEGENQKEKYAENSCHRNRFHRLCPREECCPSPWYRVGGSERREL